MSDTCQTQILSVLALANLYFRSDYDHQKFMEFLVLVYSSAHRRMTRVCRYRLGPNWYYLLINVHFERLDAIFSTHLEFFSFIIFIIIFCIGHYLLVKRP
jgi:type IV secretory pathway VirB6-like protein